MIRLTVLAVSLALLIDANATGAEIVSVKKIWDQGKHNAFTDLIYWHDAWYCTFREGDAHVGGDGKIRVLRSKDGDSWTSAALIGEPGIDLRDPKFSVTPDDRLMIVAGGSVYVAKDLKGRQPRVMFSRDGSEWTAPNRVLGEGDWLWRVTWHNGKAYGASYKTSGSEWLLSLVVSDDGVSYKKITDLKIDGRPNETTLRFLPDGTMLALVRRETKDTNAWMGTSKPPYTDWTWNDTKHRIGGPNFIRLDDGSLIAAGRSYPGGAKTVLATLTAEGQYEPILTLPSKGDTSYAGLVQRDGFLWMSYYSTHEGKTSIYLAKIRLKNS